jgi:hypothetical protein
MPKIGLPGTELLVNVSHIDIENNLTRGYGHPPPRRYPYFDVVVGLVWSHDPKSYAGGSVCYW